MKAVILLKRRQGSTHENFLLNLNIYLRPLITSLPGVSRIVVSEAVAGPGGTPAYDAMAELWFEDLDAVRRLVASQEARDTEKAMEQFVNMDAYTTFLSREHEISLPN